jgi:hypothetical protein
MKVLSACSILGLYIAQCSAVALRARNSTEGTDKTPKPQKLTGLLCRDSKTNGHGADLEVVLEEGGQRSLLFSNKVRGSDGKLIGHEIAGMQSTVHCATETKKQTCLPADLDKPVPTCAEVAKSGRCPCVAVSNEPLKLAYQQTMISEALELCQRKAKSKQTFRVLMFGLGGGAMPMYLRNKCDSAQVESVESDEHVALIAQRLLGFQADGNNKVEIADGEEAAERRARTNVWPEGPHYDMILVDCFDGSNHVASSCRSTGFVTAIHNILTSQGQVMQNVMDVDEKVVMPMYHTSFGVEATQKRVVQKGQFLIVAKTHPSHPKAQLN